MIVQALVLIWGNGTKAMRVGADQVVRFLGIQLAHAQLLSGLVSLVVLCGYNAA